MNPCALCLQPKPLCRSHIVPEFMHVGMYDDKHRFFGLSSTPERPVRFFQKGLREQLLCDDCEQQFSYYEHYASRVFYGKEVQVQPVEIGMLLSGLDYPRLKLFLLSLLWRFSVTKLEHLKGAQLGPHAERLRQMLIDEDPGRQLVYPCMITAVVHDRKHVSDLIVPPMTTHVDRQHVWNLVVAGFLMSFFVGKGSPPETLNPLFLQEGGTLVVPIRELRDIDFLHKFSLEIGAAQRARRARR
jgi:hypothetical protein